MKGSDTPPVLLPLDFPGLREIAAGFAEEMEVAQQAAWDILHGTEGRHSTPCVLDYERNAHVALLRDLSRPAAQRVWQGWLATKVGLDPTGGVVFTRTGKAYLKHKDWTLTDWNGTETTVLSNSLLEDLPAALLAALLLQVP